MLGCVYELKEEKKIEWPLAEGVGRVKNRLPLVGEGGSRRVGEARLTARSNCAGPDGDYPECAEDVLLLSRPPLRLVSQVCFFFFYLLSHPVVLPGHTHFNRKIKVE